MDIRTYFDTVYLPKMHRLGRITGFLGILAAFLPAIVLAVVYGILPKGGALLTAFIAGASSFGVLWILEPISYFSVLGPVGTYMAFLSGNISNMRVPCASMAQVAAGVEPATEKGSIAATLGMSVSIVLNVSVLTVGVILGSAVLEKLPASFIDTLNLLLPALFGALLVQFGLQAKGQTVLVLALAILVNAGLDAGWFSFLKGSENYLGILTSVFFSIAVGFACLRKEKGQSVKKEERALE